MIPLAEANGPQSFPKSPPPPLAVNRRLTAVLSPGSSRGPSWTRRSPSRPRPPRPRGGGRFRQLLRLVCMPLPVAFHGRTIALTQSILLPINGRRSLNIRTSLCNSSKRNMLPLFKTPKNHNRTSHLHRGYKKESFLNPKSNLCINSCHRNRHPQCLLPVSIFNPSHGYK